MEPHGGEEDRRAGDGRDLLIGAAPAAERPHHPRVQRLRTAPPQPRCHDLPCHSPERSLASSHGGTTAPTPNASRRYSSRAHSGIMWVIEAQRAKLWSLTITYISTM